MALAIIGVSILAVITVLIAGGVGLTKAEAQDGIWPTVTLLPLVGFPIGFLLIFVLMIVSARRRGRESRAAMEAERANQRGPRGTKPRVSGIKK